MSLTTRPATGSPYQLDRDQATSRALLQHIHKTESEILKANPKLDLFAEESENEKAGVPLCLVLAAKRHLAQDNRLKAGMILLPNPILLDSKSTICLITADPQRIFKDVIASPAFPADLRGRITRVIGVSKLREKYQTFESRRQLRREHDIFLADDRVITALPQILGTTFFKQTDTRPIPVSISGRKASGAAGSPKKGVEDEKRVGTATVVANAITKALSTAHIYLSPSPHLSIKVAFSSWSAERVAENVEAVANALAERFVPQKWRGVKSFYIKGRNTVALPIWLADELWVDKKDILQPLSPNGATDGSEPPTSKKKKLVRVEAKGIFSSKRKIDEAGGTQPLAKKKAKTAIDDTAFADVEKKKEKSKMKKRVAEERERSTDDEALVQQETKAKAEHKPSASAGKRRQQGSTGRSMDTGPTDKSSKKAKTSTVADPAALRKEKLHKQKLDIEEAIDEEPALAKPKKSKAKKKISSQD
ncbi:MAG: hypothetical protein M1829_005496 [Trizodia sp. TS-e1964]|nr:MAG: hypothetical protein M1829_005496 [Trizodia sp. TS-e1964]